MGHSGYLDPETLDEIIELMIEGESLVSICKREGMPSKGSVLRFLAKDGADNEAFRRKYERAIRLRTLNMAEEIIEIGDDGSRDWKENEDKDGNVYYTVDRDHIARSKLMCENRWKFLEKLDAKRYGKEMTLAGDPDRPLGGYTIIHNHFGDLPEEEIVPKVAPTAAALLGDRRTQDEAEGDADDI